MAIVVPSFYSVFLSSVLSKLDPNNDPFSKLSLWAVPKSEHKQDNTGAIQEVINKKCCDLEWTKEKPI